MTTHFEDIIRQNSQRLDDLKKTTEELQRELSEARVSLEREMARSPHGHAALTEQIPVYPGPAREAFSAPSPVPAQGHYTEDPLPYYAEDSRPYYAADDPPFVGEGPRYDSGAGRSGARVPADAFRGTGQMVSDRTPFDGSASGGTAFEGAAPITGPPITGPAITPLPTLPRPIRRPPTPHWESLIMGGRALTAARFPGAASSRSRVPRPSWSRCSPSSSPVAGRRGRRVWPPFRQRSPRPARTPMWYPSQAR